MPRLTFSLDSQIAGVAVWESPVKLTEEQKARKAALAEAARSAPQLEGTNVELRKDFMSLLRNLRDKYINPEEDYCA